MTFLDYFVITLYSTLLGYITHFYIDVLDEATRDCIACMLFTCAIISMIVGVHLFIFA